MKKVSRELAKTQLSIFKIADSTEEYLKQILISDYIYRNGKNEGENIKYNSIYDKSVSKFLIKHFKNVILKGVSNVFLSSYMEKTFGKEVEIVGDVEKMYPCSCCQYLTIEEKGAYDVCRVCKWEDDGTLPQEFDKFSHANGSTLKDYRDAFLKKDNIVLIFDKI